MKIQGFEPRCNEDVTTVEIEPRNIMRSTSTVHRAILALSGRTGFTLYYMKPLHILKSIWIQGFEPRCNEYVTTVGIEPSITMRCTSLNHWAILALPAKRRFTFYYIKPFHILKSMIPTVGIEPPITTKSTSLNHWAILALSVRRGCTLGYIYQTITHFQYM